MFDDPGRVYTAIGLAIAAARRAKAVSQDQLGSALGLSRGSVSNIEAGRQKVLVHTLLQAAVYLGVPVAQLIPSARMVSASVHDAEVELNSNRRLQRSERDEIVAAVHRVHNRAAE
jgi:transcriptional regulator with XRE-family HTH domain